MIVARAVILLFTLIEAGWMTFAMIVAAAGSLWFLPLGTVCGIIQLVLLLAWRARLR